MNPMTNWVPVLTKMILKKIMEMKDGIEDRTELHRSELGQFQACYLLDNHERAYINYEEAVHKLLKLGCRRVKKLS